MIKKLLLLVVLVVVVGLVAVYLYRNALVEAAVEESGNYVLGVPTDLGSAGLDLGGGSLSLDNYSISNPEGFEGEHFLVLERGVLDVESGSILDDEVVVDSLVLEGFRISLEQIDKKGNYLAILDNLKKFELSSSSESNKRLKISKLALRDIGVDASLTLMGKKQVDKSFTVENITLENVGGGEGTSVGGLIKTVVTEVLTKATSGGLGIPGIDVDAEIDKLKEEGTDKLEEAAKDQ
ncbi:MAG: hypothetical protein GY854_07035, partial [Deltaproteobacteria bacterium]|nr:hypothetical protein [Deltaproteobacteria bacterium]